MGSGKSRKCLSTILSYCWDISDPKHMSAVWHCAGRRDFCVRFPSTQDNMLTGEENSDGVIPETIHTLRTVSKLQEEATSLAEKGFSRRWRAVLEKIGSLSLRQSLAETPLSLGKMCGSVGVVVENLLSIFRLESVENLYSRASKSLKTFLTRCVSLEEIHSYQKVWLESKKK